MYKSRHYVGRFIVALMLFASCTAISDEETESRPSQGAVSGDYVATGGHVELASEVNGDVYAAGGSILIQHPVNGDAVAAGGNVTIQGKVRDDVYAAGGSIVLDSEVGGDANLAGGHVSVAKNARINGKASLKGGDVEIRGLIAKDVQIRAGTVRLGGEIRGNTDVTAHEVEVLPTARITGSLTYRSPQQAKIDPAAQILGGVNYAPMEMERGVEAVAGVAGVIGVILFLIGLILFGGILLLLFAKFTLGAASTVGSDPGKSLALGFALLVTIPVSAVLLFITIIGIPVGMMVILLYPVALLLGYFTVALYVAGKGLALARKEQPPTTGWRFVALVASLILLSMLHAIPVIGSLIVFFLLMIGLGAFVLHLYRSYKRGGKNGGALPAQAQPLQPA